jgi:cell division protein FtsL
MNIWKYITAFLSGALVLAIYALKIAKPVINTDNYIESLDQNIKKLKQSGENNTQDVILDALQAEKTEQKKKERKPFLGIRLRKKKD